MNEKFSPELARCLRQEGIATSPMEKDRLPLLLDDQRFRLLAEYNGVVLPG